MLSFDEFIMPQKNYFIIVFMIVILNDKKIQIKFLAFLITQLLIKYEL